MWFVLALLVRSNAATSLLVRNSVFFIVTSLLRIQFSVYHPALDPLHQDLRASGLVALDTRAGL
jgi:hypothetical protein